MVIVKTLSGQLGTVHQVVLGSGFRLKVFWEKLCRLSDWTHHGVTLYFRPLFAISHRWAIDWKWFATQGYNWQWLERPSLIDQWTSTVQTWSKSSKHHSHLNYSQQEHIPHHTCWSFCTFIFAFWRDHNFKTFYNTHAANNGNNLFELVRLG